MPFQLAKAHDVEVAIGFMSFEEVCEFCPFPSNKQKQFGVIPLERYNPLLPQRLPGAPNSGTWDGSLKTKDHWAWSWTFCCHCSILKDMNSHSLLHKIARYSRFFCGTFKSDPSISTQRPQNPSAGGDSSWPWHHWPRSVWGPSHLRFTADFQIGQLAFQGSPSTTILCRSFLLQRRDWKI